MTKWPVCGRGTSRICPERAQRYRNWSIKSGVQEAMRGEFATCSGKDAHRHTRLRAVQAIVIGLCLLADRVAKEDALHSTRNYRMAPDQVLGHQFAKRSTAPTNLPVSRAGGPCPKQTSCGSKAASRRADSRLSFGSGLASGYGSRIPPENRNGS